MKTISRGPEQGSYSTLWALTAPEVESKDQNGDDPDTLGSENSQASDGRAGRGAVGGSLVKSWSSTSWEMTG
ncbi:hypothetical protein BB8028_0001g12860 [Beauveria bassiana]|uniref:Uncharacterized protein n=1 Tax=Beauveria bassiana TaxID=176275 RepID=A0A2S7XZ85_BEABA|nr:hypothetical protein BB8028_0001g12860 [Beauveria bassiana]